MQTFAAPKPLEPNQNFEAQKQSSLTGLKDHMIEAPIVEIINRFKHQDTAMRDYAETRRVEAVRNNFFDQITQVEWESL